MAVQSDETTLYEHGFDGVVAELEGLTPPLSPFSIGRWRIGALGSWVTFAAIAWMVVALLRGDDTVRERGRWVAAACAVAAVVVFAIAWVALAGSADALALAGLGRGWVAAEAALAGMAGAAVVLVVASIRATQTQRIQSAPPGGAYGRLQQPLVRPTPPPREIIHARIDGPSTLAPADEVIVTQPGPVETTVRSYPPPPPPPKPKR
jgi:hypothetical protein